MLKGLRIKFNLHLELDQENFLFYLFPAISVFGDRVGKMYQIELVLWFWRLEVWFGFNDDIWNIARGNLFWKIIK